MSLGLNSIVRQYVLTTASLPQASGQLHDFLGAAQGPSHEYTLEFGFVNENMLVGDTYIEIGQPIWAEHRYHDILAPKGDCTQMVLFQTGNIAAMRERALERGLTLTKDKTFQDQPVLQFDFEVYGTRFEAWEYSKPDGWWAGPREVFTDSTAVESVLGADIAVADPLQAADDLAAVLLAERIDDVTLDLDGKRLRFVPAAGAWTGVTAIDLKPLDSTRSGDSRVICGTEFRYI